MQHIQLAYDLPVTMTGLAARWVKGGKRIQTERVTGFGSLFLSLPRPYVCGHSLHCIPLRSRDVYRG